MWNCAICGSQNAEDQKICAHCTSFRAEQPDHKLSDPEIAHPVPEDNDPAANAAIDVLRESAHRRRQNRGGPFSIGRGGQIPQRQPRQHEPLLRPRGGNGPAHNNYQAMGNVGGQGHAVGGPADDDPISAIITLLSRSLSCDSRAVIGLLTSVLPIILYLVVISLATVQPTEWALRENLITGTVHRDYAYERGLYLIGFWNRFVKFPRHQVMVELSSDQNAYMEPLQCRTGRDGMEEATGGQPLSLHVHFMYKIERQSVGKVHRRFGLAYHERFTDFSRQAISDVAQRYTPYEFWKSREKVAKAMGVEVNEWLQKYGDTNLTMFQVTKIGFHPKFERMIVDIQLQVQLYVTNEYRQQLVKVDKEIDVMESIAHSKILAINAWAFGNSSVIIANATNTGLNITQGAKARHYREFADELGLTSRQIVQYIRTTTIGEHESKDLVLGLSYPFSNNGASGKNTKKGWGF
ncbi:hypothetical protein AAMO2058_001749000 [Amorphochlora amoebiformis]